MTEEHSHENVEIDVRHRIAELELEMLQNLKQCIDNLMVLANGVTVEQEQSGESPIIYTRPPDRAANEYILNRVLGRPPSNKTLSPPEPPKAPRVDLSKIPKDRLETMQRWLIEADEKSIAVESRSDTPECDRK